MVFLVCLNRDNRLQIFYLIPHQTLILFLIGHVRYNSCYMLTEKLIYFVFCTYITANSIRSS
ncbi:MAG: hypothetical protein Q8M06_11725 [Methanobacteriaceae archaeon]|nr:hypothetical protein [Methanobacteriaceae archaeon]